MKRTLLTLAAGIALGLVLGAALEGYRWKKNVDLRGWKGETAYQYLAEPAFKGPNGEALSRAQALDLLFAQLTQKK